MLWGFTYVYFYMCVCVYLSMYLYIYIYTAMKAGPARAASADAAEARAVVASVAATIVNKMTRVELRAKGVSFKRKFLNYIWCISIYRSMIDIFISV